MPRKKSYLTVTDQFCNYVDGFYVYRVDGRTMSAAIRRGRFEMVDVAVYKLKETAVTQERADELG